MSPTVFELLNTLSLPGAIVLAVMVWALRSWKGAGSRVTLQLGPTEIEFFREITDGLGDANNALAQIQANTASNKETNKRSATALEVIRENSAATRDAMNRLAAR